MYEKVFQEAMADLWKNAAIHENMRDLISEIVARGDVTVEDNVFVFSTVGELEARTLKYTLTLEK